MIYISLTIAAIMGVDKANEWFITYITAFFADMFAFQTMINFIKISLIRREIYGYSSGTIFTKLFGDEELIDYLKGK